MHFFFNIVINLTNNISYSGQKTLKNKYTYFQQKIVADLVGSRANY